MHIYFYKKKLCLYIVSELSCVKNAPIDMPDIVEIQTSRNMASYVMNVST